MSCPPITHAGRKVALEKKNSHKNDLQNILTLHTNTGMAPSKNYLFEHHVRTLLVAPFIMALLKWPSVKQSTLDYIMGCLFIKQYKTLQIYWSVCFY